MSRVLKDQHAYAGRREQFENIMNINCHREK